MSNTRKNTTSSNLKKMREKAGMTTQELSEKSGVNLRMIYHYEEKTKDINGCKVTTAIKLVQALGCEIQDILEE